MEYCKPELTLVGRAADVIQSGLTKGPVEGDHISGPMTNPPAYQSDE